MSKEAGLRLRDRSGKLIPLPEGTAFLELATAKDAVAFVIALRDDGSFIVLDKDNAEGRHYAAALGLNFTPTKVLKLPC